MSFVIAAAEVSPPAKKVLEMPGSASAASYIGSFDVLRVLAALAVVWIHTMEFNALDSQVFWARFAVPAFTAMSVFLLGISSIRKEGSELTRDGLKRAWSVYRLFLIWNCIYLGARLIKHSVFHQGQSINLCFSAAAIAGFVGHLWYLPFIALCGLVLVWPLRWFMGLSGPAALTVSVFLIIAAVGGNALAGQMPVDYEHYPWTYFVFLSLSTLPSALLICPVAWLWNRRMELLSRTELGIALPLMALGLLFASSRMPSVANLFHNVAAIVLVIGALPWIAYLAGCTGWRRLGELALPAYLIHILVLDVLRLGAHKLHLGESVILELVLFSFTGVASFVVAALLASKPQVAWLISVRPRREVVSKVPKVL